MRSFQQKKGWGGILHSKPVLILLAFILMIFAWAVLQLMIKMQTTRENRKIAESKVAELRDQKEKLSANIASLKTQNGIEENIREKFGWAKAGEGLVIVVDDANKEKAPEQKPEGFFSSLMFWKNWFK